MDVSPSRARPRRDLRGLFAGAALALALAAGFAGCGASSTATGPLAAATVDGHAVPLSDYQQMVTYYKAAAASQQSGAAADSQTPNGRGALAGVQGQAMDFLVNLEVMRQLLAQHTSDKGYSAAAYQAELKKDQKQLNDEIAAARKSVDPSQKAALEAQLNALSDRVKYLFAEQQATENTLLKFVSLKTVHLRAMVVTDPKQAQDLVAQLRGGADFNQLAAKVNPNPARANWDYGDQWEGGLPPTFTPAVFAQGHPKYDSVPFTGQSGTTQYVVTEATNDRTQKLATVNDMQQEQSIFGSWLTAVYRPKLDSQHKITQSVYIPAASSASAAPQG